MATRFSQHHRCVGADLEQSAGFVRRFRRPICFGDIGGRGPRVRLWWAVFCRPAPIGSRLTLSAPVVNAPWLWGTHLRFPGRRFYFYDPGGGFGWGTDPVPLVQHLNSLVRLMRPSVSKAMPVPEPSTFVLGRRGLGQPSIGHSAQTSATPNNFRPSNSQPHKPRTGHDALAGRLSFRSRISRSAVTSSLTFDGTPRKRTDLRFLRRARTQSFTRPS